MTVKLPGMDNETSDEELMLRYRNGDAHAFEHLYARHKRALYRYFLRKCQNESIADELYQDVWTKIINARNRYEAKAKFTTWLYQLASNHFIDYYRKNKKENALVTRNDCDEMENIPAHQNQQPEQQLLLSRKTSALLKLISELPEEQREVFLLKEEAGMDLPEIAKITGVNVETAKSRLRYAINKLRKGLELHE